MAVNGPSIMALTRVRGGLPGAVRAGPGGQVQGAGSRAGAVYRARIELC